MLKVKNRDGMMIDLPDFQKYLPKVEVPDDRFSKPKNKISKAQRAELRLKLGGRCAYCGCQLPEKGWQPYRATPRHGRPFR